MNRIISKQEELKKLDAAILQCQRINQQLGDSVKLVRRLNIIHNPQWVLDDYKQYVADKRKHLDRQQTHSIKVPYQHGISVQKLKKTKKPPPPPISFAVGTRSSGEILCSNSKINTKFIKVKRSFESLYNQLQRTLHTANRQKDLQHKFDINNKSNTCNH